jgi:hypothetical protein
VLLRASRLLSKLSSPERSTLSCHTFHSKSVLLDQFIPGLSLDSSCCSSNLSLQDLTLLDEALSLLKELLFLLIVGGRGVGSHLWLCGCSRVKRGFPLGLEASLEGVNSTLNEASARMVEAPVRERLFNAQALLTEGSVHADFFPTMGRAPAVLAVTNFDHMFDKSFAKVSGREASSRLDLEHLIVGVQNRSSLWISSPILPQKLVIIESSFW